MKKIRVKTVVYDRTTMEYIQKWIEYPISEELATMIHKEFAENGFSGIQVYGFGAGIETNKLPGLRTPLCSQKRFAIDPQFHVIDEEGKELAGWRGF